MIDTILEHDSRIVAGVLFGSRARGDADSDSDVDIALFARAETAEELCQIRSSFNESVTLEEIAFSLYSTRTAELLARDGSLFLWHLSLEGRIFFENDGWLSSLLGSLAPYGIKKGLRDLNTFDRILSDAQYALIEEDAVLLFETATTFAILRNLGIIHAFMQGCPCFGRLSPVWRLRTVMGDRFPLAIGDIERLQAAKLVFSRPRAQLRPLIEATWCQEMVSKVQELLMFVRGEIYAEPC